MAWCEANGHGRAGAPLRPRGRRSRRRHAPARAAHAAGVVRRPRRDLSSRGSSWYDDAIASATRRSPCSARGSTTSPAGPRRAPAGSARRRRARRRPCSRTAARRSSRGSRRCARSRVPTGSRRCSPTRELALEQLGPEGWWRPTAQLALGVAHVLLGDSERGREALAVASELAAAAGASEEGSAALAELAFVAMEAGAWEQAAIHAARAVAIVEEAGLDDYIVSGLALAAAARDRDPPRRRQAGARGRRARFIALRPLLNHGLPWMSVQLGLELARIHLALGEAGVAGTVLGEAEEILRVRPRLGSLAELARELRATRRGHDDTERPVGAEPDGRRAAAAAAADDASGVSADRRAAVPLAHDDQDAGRLDLPQVRRLVARRGDRARRRARAARGLALPGSSRSLGVAVTGCSGSTSSGVDDVRHAVA